MKRKLIYSVSICVLAFTLVSAMIADKPMKTQNINVPDLYEEIGEIPGGPLTVNEGANDEDIIWTLINETNCHYEVDAYFGINADNSYSPASTIILDLPPTNNTGYVTLGDIKNQYAAYSLTPPFNITHGALRVRIPPTGAWGTGNTAYAGQNPYEITIQGESGPCACVKVYWDITSQTITLSECD